MTTKKQKREEAERRRERFLESYRQDGLAAQRRDREIREARAERAKADAKRAERLKQNAG
jgi:hypothetical protein